MQSHPITPVILCGGSGTRLWPLSRRNAPKQFVDLGHGKTLFGDTVERTQALSKTNPLVVVTNESYRFAVAGILAAKECEATIILEPSPNNTAPAIALAMLSQGGLANDDLLLILPADHAIGDTQIFVDAVEKASLLAKEGMIVTFGVVPTQPETGYGYIESGTPLSNQAYTLTRFIEKPKKEDAIRYVKSGTFFWNSGIFLLSRKTLNEELTLFAPTIHKLVTASWEQRTIDGFFVRPNRQIFSQVPSISFDYAIMEKTTKACVLPLSTAWSDLGSWEAFYQNGTKDENGNVCEGDILTDNAHNNYGRSQKRLLALVGVDNLAVIETADAILVAARNQVQSVKQIVARLSAQKRPECEEHLHVNRPWGSYEILGQGKRFQVKRIVVNPGAEISLQMHHHRAEHWVVVSGTAEVTKGESTILLTENESTYIPIGQKHRLKNPGLIPLILIEIQSGSYLGEDDIIRFSDNYGRRESERGTPNL
ncbi:MAG: mannose-1-phosphate guanylyltransferase/mannose-6-phosphate isomerase [Desulfovibrio sp.]|nr:mannose-1-phosphate guanylyltransferase/mannose-6-phosphate isomerase [Desulfovibrio sp.]